jgi:hypothetical protein
MIKPKFKQLWIYLYCRPAGTLQSFRVFYTNLQNLSPGSKKGHYREPVPVGLSPGITPVWICVGAIVVLKGAIFVLKIQPQNHQLNSF